MFHLNISKLDTQNTQIFKIQPLGVFKVEIPMRIIRYLRGGCENWEATKKFTV